MADPVAELEDSRMAAILREYLEAEDAGSAPSRDQLLGRYPDYRSELTAFFETADHVQDCKRWLVPTATRGRIASDAIAGYEIYEEIGRGGMGIVYRAVQPLLNRSVALKLLKADDPSITQRLLVEARTAARLDHPGIVS